MLLFLLVRGIRVARPPDVSRTTPRRTAARRPGQQLHYWRRTPAGDPPLPAEEAVICQDEWLIVAGKPHFMPVTPSGLHK